jgi:DNA-binding SARP family transcriptional activator
MSTLNANLFGKLCVQYNEHELEGFEARKVRELFCYLLLHWNRPHPRETLVELLWHDNQAIQSRKNLRQTLWQLQAALSSQIRTEEPLLLVEADWVQINPKSDLWLDVALFEQTFATVQGKPGQELDGCQIQALEKAIGLYQGDLLEGWYEDWCIYERERLHGMYLSMLDKLMDYCEAHRDFDTGLIYGLRILCHDRTRERTHRRMMRLHCMAGDRAAALRQYERCAVALQEELDVKPSRRTMALYKQIRSGQLEEPGQVVIEADTNLDLLLPPLPDLLNHLRTLQGVLDEVQYQLRQSTEALENILECSYTRPLFNIR